MLNALALPLLFLAISALIFFQDILVIHDLWMNNHSHDLGYPTLALCLFFSYQSYANKPAYEWTPSFPLLTIGLACAIALYILSNTVNLQAPRLLAYLLIAVFFIGINVTSQQRLGQILAFCLLLYTIPIWGIFTNLLQLLTVKATSIGLELSRIPAIIHGYYISLPGGTLEVEEGCAGVRYLVTTLLICHMFCLLNKPDLKGWIMIFVAGGALALAANWIRVYILSYVAYKTDLKHPWIHDHTSLGWAVYSFIYIPLYFISGSVMSLSTTSSEFSFINSPGNKNLKPSLLTLLATLTLISVPYALSQFKAKQHIEPTTFTQPENIGLCYLNKTQSTSMPPAYIGFDQIFSASYDCTDGKIETHYLIYNRQTQGKELINIFNATLDTKIWQIINTDEVTEPFEFLIETHVNNEGKHALTAHSYIVDNQLTTSHQTIRNILIKKGLIKEVPAKMISIAMPCSNDCKSENSFIRNIFISYKKLVAP